MSSDQTPRIPYYDPQTAPQNVRDMMKLFPVERNASKLLANSGVFFEPVMKTTSASWSPDRTIRSSEWQVAVLRTASLFDCPYEWQVNEPLARLFGFDTDIMLLALRSGDLSDPDAFSDRHRLVARMVHELFHSRMLTEGTTAEAVGVFGAEGVTEIINIHGIYAHLALVLKTADIHSDPPVPNLEETLKQFNAAAIEKEKQQREDDLKLQS